MGVQSLEITFDRPSKTFFAGEKIVGTIEVQADKAENIEGEYSINIKKHN